MSFNPYKQTSPIMFVPQYAERMMYWDTDNMFSQGLRSAFREPRPYAPETTLPSTPSSRGPSFSRPRSAGIRRSYGPATPSSSSIPELNAAVRGINTIADTFGLYNWMDKDKDKDKGSDQSNQPRRMTRREKKKAELARRQAIDQDIRQKGLSVGYGGEPSQYDYTGQYEFQVGNAQRAIERRQMDDAFTAMDERLDREFDVTDTGLRPKPIPQEQSPPISGLRPPFDPSDREMTPEEMKSAEEKEQQARAPGGPLYNPYGYEELLERAKTLPPKTQEEAKKQRKMEAKLRVDRTRREAQSGSPSEPPSRPSTVLEGSRSARDQMAEALEPAGRVSQVTTTTGSGGQSTYRERTSNRPRTSAYELRLQSRIAQELNAKNM